MFAIDCSPRIRDRCLMPAIAADDGRAKTVVAESREFAARAFRANAERTIECIDGHDSLQHRNRLQPIVMFRVVNGRKQALPITTRPGPKADPVSPSSRPEHHNRPPVSRSGPLGRDEAWFWLARDTLLPRLNSRHAALLGQDRRAAWSCPTIGQRDAARQAAEYTWPKQARRVCPERACPVWSHCDPWAKPQPVKRSTPCAALCSTPVANWALA
jgi:hypothetical protein